MDNWGKMKLAVQLIAYTVHLHRITCNYTQYIVFHCSGCLQFIKVMVRDYTHFEKCY